MKFNLKKTILPIVAATVFTIGNYTSAEAGPLSWVKGLFKSADEISVIEKSKMVAIHPGEDGKYDASLTDLASKIGKPKKIVISGQEADTLTAKWAPDGRFSGYHNADGKKIEAIASEMANKDGVVGIVNATPNNKIDAAQLKLENTRLKDGLDAYTKKITGKLSGKKEEVKQVELTTAKYDSTQIGEAQLDSITKAYEKPINLKFGREILTLKKQIKELSANSPVADSLDKLILTSRGNVDDKAIAYNRKIRDLRSARDDLEQMTTKYAKTLKNGNEVSHYRKHKEGREAFILAANLAGYDGTTTKAVTKKIQLANRAKVDGIPGKETSFVTRKKLDGKINDLVGEKNSYTRDIESNIKGYKTEKATEIANLSEKNKKELAKVQSGLSKVYQKKAEDIIDAAMGENRLPVREALITDAIGVYVMANKAKASEDISKRIAKLERWKENPIKMEGKKGITLPKILEKQARKINAKNAAFVNVYDRIINPNETKTFKMSGAKVDLDGRGNITGLEFKLPTAYTGVLLGMEYESSSADAILQSTGKKIGSRESSSLNMHAGLEGSHAIKQVKGLTLDYKALVGFLNSSQTVQRENEPGVKRDLDKTSLQRQFELGFTYGNNKFFDAGFNIGYNSVNQMSEMTSGGPTGKIGTEATDKFSEISLGLPFEITIHKKANLSLEPQMTISSFRQLEDVLNEKYKSFGGQGIVNLDKVAVGAKAMKYPGVGHRGDIFAYVAPFEKVPVKFTGNFGFEKVNSSSADLTNTYKSNEFHLGVMFGGTAKQLYNQIKQIRPKVNKK